MTQQEALNSFLKEVARQESGKSEANIGDLRQALRIINQYIPIYGLIKALEEAKLTLRR